MRPVLMISLVLVSLSWLRARCAQDDTSELTVPAAPARNPDHFVVRTPPPELRADPFYKKYASVHDYPIVASENVDDYALKEAAYLIGMMMAERPDVLKRMIASGSRLCILAHNEFTTDLPEFAHFRPKDYWDARARGTGGSRTDPYCSCGEENLLGFSGDPYATECILIHEFAHNIHLRGLVQLDPTFDDRLKKAYQLAMQNGLWEGKYASVNHHEYFAEGVQSWFDNNRPPDHDHNHVDTRAELIEYDSNLAAICREVFGETKLKYTKPVTRLHGHLEGYVPGAAPKFQWPERLNDAHESIRRNVRRRNQKKAPRKESSTRQPERRQTRVIAGWQVHLSEELLKKQAAATERALELLKSQLDQITRVVPKGAVAELQKVSLWISPEYPGTKPSAEYHPDAGWLRNHGRDPAMARAVEFTNVDIFEAETRRMPNFVLHELAHAYHHRVLEGGFAHIEIKAAYEKAKSSGTYERVERWHGNGRANTFERAYAMTNPMEYFAECSEAFFSRNDFFPFNKEELKRHDPGMFELLGKLWGVLPEQERIQRKTAPALKQAAVDFNHPPRDYVAHGSHGWSIFVEEQLHDEAPEVGKTALARLKSRLGRVVEVLPVSSLHDLRRVKVFLMYGTRASAGGRGNGLEYFQASSPEHNHWLDPRMGSSIVIFCADNYVNLSELWAIKSLVHELGHAQHLEHWPEDRADIYDTWERAMKAGLYQQVREEDKAAYLPNYAAQNHLEYFAELTAMYFVGCNYYPTNRAELKAYDPDGYALIEKLWEVGEGVSGETCLEKSNRE